MGCGAQVLGSKFYDDLGPQKFVLLLALLASRSQEMVDPTKSISLTSQQSKSLVEQRSLEDNDRLTFKFLTMTNFSSLERLAA